jgi:hypothetical protein
MIVYVAGLKPIKLYGGFRAMSHCTRCNMTYASGVWCECRKPKVRKKPGPKIVLSKQICSREKGKRMKAIIQYLQADRNGATT